MTSQYRHAHRGADLPGQGDVCNPCARGGRPGRRQDGNRDPVVRHQGRCGRRGLPDQHRQGADGRGEGACRHRGGRGVERVRHCGE